jgi:hypothetical protein
MLADQRPASGEKEEDNPGQRPAPLIARYFRWPRAG